MKQDILQLFQHLRLCWRRILIVHLIFTVLGLVLLTPLFGLLLQGALWLTGSAAVVDQEIASLLLSPFGFVGGVLLAAILIAITGLELGAQLLAAHDHLKGGSAPPLQLVRYTFSRAPQLLELTLRITIRCLMYLLPYLAVGVGCHGQGE